MMNIQIIGHLGNDAEIKTFNGKNYISMSVACSDKDKSGNERTTWVSCLWGREAGNILQYLKKGVKVFLSGRLVPSAYIDKNGKPQVNVNMYVNVMEMCGGAQQQAHIAEHVQQAQTQSQAPQQDYYQPDNLPF